MSESNKGSLADLLVKLDKVVGVSGDESLVAEAIRAEMSGYYHEHYEDALGNNVFIRKGKRDDLKLMLSAHMDELGFLVNYIEESGMVRFVPVGYHDDRMIIDQDLVIHTGDGPIYGITGAKPAHILTEEERKKVIPLSDIFIDVGTSERKETEKLGVKIGDFVSFNRTGYFMNGGKVFSGKSVDDRSGCAVMVEVMKRLKDEDIIPTIYAVASVQEEIGIRGAGVAAYTIKPDVALALDVTLSGGTPGVEIKDVSIQLGKGAAIKFYDWAPHNGNIGNAVPKKLTGKLVELAEANGIQYQREVLMNAGTDGWSISLSGNGVLTGVISIPSRYIHSAIGTVHMDDMENAVRLIISYIKQYGL